MAEIDPNAPTELLPMPRAAHVPVAATPVFVDPSGRRRRLAHRIAVAMFLAASAYVLMVIWSLLGGPVAPDTLMPFSAPHPATSTVPTAHLSSAASAAARAPSSSATPQATRDAAGSAATTAASPTGAPSATASASPSAGATAPGHRPTSAPGKPSATATGHGH